MANTKTTKATTKAVVKKDVEADEIVEVVETKEVKNSKKVYSAGDRISCKSINAGQMVYYSTKTNERYEWSNYGDITDVLYEDLLSMKSAKSNYLYAPYFVIQDEELLADKAWSKILEVYENIEIIDDVEDYFSLSPDKLKQVLSQAPDGLKATLKATASKMIGNGTLDSVRKIRIVDEVLGTSFASFVY